MTKTILVIEDNEEIREAVVEILQLNHYRVYSAEDGKKGLAAIPIVNPDAILCDIMMPDVNGYEVLQTVQLQPELAGIPFIFMTAKSSDSGGKPSTPAQTIGFLAKPFDEDQLLWAISTSLAVKKAGNQPAA